MHIESSGVTVDTVPVSNVQSFLGWEQLHLQHTSAVANDSPFMDGIVDAQPVYTNPFDIGYSFDQEYYGAESFNADVNGGYSGNYAGQGESSFDVANPPNEVPPQELHIVFKPTQVRFIPQTPQLVSMDNHFPIRVQPLWHGFHPKSILTSHTWSV